MAEQEAVTRDRIRTLVADAIGEASGTPVGEKVLDQTLDELGIDSLTLVDVLFLVEDALGEEIAEEALEVVTSGGTLSRLIEVQLGGPRAAPGG